MVVAANCATAKSNPLDKVHLHVDLRCKSTLPTPLSPNFTHSYRCANKISFTFSNSNHQYLSRRHPPVNAVIWQRQFCQTKVIPTHSHMANSMSKIKCTPSPQSSCIPIIPHETHQHTKATREIKCSKPISFIRLVMLQE